MLQSIFFKYLSGRLHFCIIFWSRQRYIYIRSQSIPHQSSVGEQKKKRKKILRQIEREREEKAKAEIRSLDCSLDVGKMESGLMECRFHHNQLPSLAPFPMFTTSCAPSSFGNMCVSQCSDDPRVFSRSYQSRMLRNEQVCSYLKQSQSDESPYLDLHMASLTRLGMPYILKIEIIITRLDLIRR